MRTGPRPDVPVVGASVIVPTHRGAHRIGTLLEALAGQTFDGSWEVVVVIDGTVDGTADVLETFATKLPLRVVPIDEPAGVAAALNRGYAEAVGRVLIRCDDDLTPGRDMLARHVEWHRGAGLRGVIGATRDRFPDTPYARVYGASANRQSLAASYRRDPRDLWIHWAAHNSVTREAWDLVGGFDETFPYGEDSELGWRLQQAGVTLHLDPELEIEHRGPALGSESRMPRAYVSGASRSLFQQVHPQAHRPAVGPKGVLTRLWDAATWATAWLIRTWDGYRRVGAAVDWSLSRVPAALGARLVAFGVEAAGKAGLRYGATDLRDFQRQKAREVDAELGTGATRDGGRARP
jgi:GT2 family glycosyltransferase